MQRVAVNQFGDVCSIAEDWSIRLASLKSSEPMDLSSFPLDSDSMTLIKSLKFSNIEYNSNGTILLLWSDYSIGVIEIPKALAPDGCLLRNTSKVCNFFFIAEDYISTKRNNEKILNKASFHPMSPFTVVVLTKNSLLLIDVTNPMENRLIPLGSRHNFRSFCFGQNMDWLKFSIFLLEDKADRTQIYCLCPVISKGMIVSRESVNDLWNWIDENEPTWESSTASIGGAGQFSVDSRRLENDRYIGSVCRSNPSGMKQLVSNFLTASFGPQSDIVRGSSSGGGDGGYGESNNWNQKHSSIRVGEYTSSLTDQGLFAEHEILLTMCPRLQGPFTLKTPNPPNSSRSSTSQGLRKHPTDITVPTLRDTGAPVLAVAYSDGDVGFLVLDPVQNEVS